MTKLKKISKTFLRLPSPDWVDYVRMRRRAVSWWKSRPWKANFTVPSERTKAHSDFWQVIHTRSCEIWDSNKSAKLCRLRPSGEARKHECNQTSTSSRPLPAHSGQGEVSAQCYHTGKNPNFFTQMSRLPLNDRVSKWMWNLEYKCPQTV